MVNGCFGKFDIYKQAIFKLKTSFLDQVVYLDLQRFKNILLML